jgi:hypothetical protein
MRDLMNNIDVKRAISPVSVADNTATVSEIIDTTGYKSLTFVIATGSLADADATFAVLVEDGDNASLTDNAAVADAELVGTEALAAFAFGDDNECRKIGYRGAKRYVRMTITPSNNASAALIAAVAVLEPNVLPAANPPA